MALTTEQRRANYKAQRDGGALTAKQRRRIRKQEHKAERVVGTLRVSRVRRAYDRAERLKNRRAAQALIHAIRSGQLKPSFQAALRNMDTRDRLVSAIETTKEDSE